MFSETGRLTHHSITVSFGRFGCTRIISVDFNNFGQPSFSVLGLDFFGYTA